MALKLAPKFFKIVLFLIFRYSFHSSPNNNNNNNNNNKMGVTELVLIQEHAKLIKNVF